jgi:hypothetical protein
MLTLVQQDAIEHARMRAIAQIMVSKEKAVEVFDSYVIEAFPWIEAVKQREKDESKEMLQRWVSGGPMVVDQILEPKFRSTLKTKMVTAEEAARAGYQRPDRLGRKIGSVFQAPRKDKRDEPNQR